MVVNYEVIITKKKKKCIFSLLKKLFKLNFFKKFYDQTSHLLRKNWISNRELILDRYYKKMSEITQYLFIFMNKKIM